MNALNERRNDPENFGARITRFGVVVEKIWNFEVLGLFLRGKTKKKPWTTSELGPWWTATVRPGAWWPDGEGEWGTGVSPQGSLKLGRR
jgi:hypothetical protein